MPINASHATRALPHSVVALCSHLFWAVGGGGDGGGSGGSGGGGGGSGGGGGGDGSGGYDRRDARRVLECLQRALKIADACMAGGANVVLFVEVGK
jgi:Vacuolar protein sorting-associated protein 35